MNVAKTLVAALSLVAISASAEVKIVRDIQYRPGEADPYVAEACMLDIKTPASATGFPTVVWFHGGGLVKGKRKFINICDSIAQVTVDERLRLDALFPGIPVVGIDGEGQTARCVDFVADGEAHIDSGGGGLVTALGRYFLEKS